MQSAEPGVVYGGEIAVAGVLLVSGILTILSAVLTSQGLELAVFALFGLWLVTLAYLFPTRSVKWHVAALITVALLCIVNILALIGGGIGLSTLVGALLSLIGTIYLASTIDRKRRSYEA